jgi:hypothetical protein
VEGSPSAILFFECLASLDFTLCRVKLHSLASPPGGGAYTRRFFWRDTRRWCGGVPLHPRTLFQALHLSCGINTITLVSLPAPSPLPLRSAERGRKKGLGAMASPPPPTPTAGREGGPGQREGGGSAFHPTIREPDPPRVMSELIS